MRTTMRPRWQATAAGAGCAAALLLDATGFAGSAAAQSKRSQTKTYAVERDVDGPLIAVVSIGDQRINVFDKNGRVAHAPVSTGKPGHRTPMGAFSIIQRKVQHTSNLYFAEMPYMQRLTWSGIALHAGVIPGYPASHGCIRLPMSFARELYRMTELGTRVIVAPDEATPQPITHANLFAPQPVDIKPLLTRIAPDRDAAGLMTVAFAANTPPQRAPQMIPGVMRLGVASANEKAAPPSAGQTGASEAKTLDELRRDAEAAVAQTSERAKDAERELVELRGRHAKAISTFSGLERASSRAVARLEGAQTAFSRARTVRAVEAAIDAEQRAALAVADIAADLDDVGPDAKVARDEIQEAREKLRATRATQADAQSLVRELDRMAKPVHVKISAKTGMIYVRQGYEPILEAPVTIKDADQPLGTHVFTAMSTAEKTATWSVVSIEQKDAVRERRRAQRAAAAPAPDMPSATPAEALDRITIPDDVRRRVSELLTPGSSLIVSDEPPSRETGKGTDIIVVTR